MRRAADASRALGLPDERVAEAGRADAAARRRLLSTLASALTDDPEGSPRTATAALGLGLGLGSPPPPPSLGAPASVPLLAPPPPSEAGRLAKDVASYAAESLRAHSRLTRACAETLRRATTGERVGGGAGPEGVAFAIAKTRRVLEALRAETPRLNWDAILTDHPQLFEIGDMAGAARTLARSLARPGKDGKDVADALARQPTLLLSVQSGEDMISYDHGSLKQVKATIAGDRTSDGW